LHTLSAKNAEQVILEGEEEAGTAGVALTAGAPTELVVDTAGIVALRTDDVEATQGHNFVVLNLAE